MFNPSRCPVALAVCLALAAVTPVGATQVTFQVDMSTQAGYGLFVPGADAVAVRGSFDGWAGDHYLTDVNEDLVYAGTLDLATASHAYKFVFLPAGGGIVWEYSIPDRVVAVGADPIVLDPAYFDDDDTVPVPPRDVEVVFSVDASLPLAWGELDPDEDLVVVRGSHAALGDWGGTGAVLARDGASPRYTGWVSFDDLSNYPVFYKFVILESGDPDSARWEWEIDNRSFRIVGDEPDVLPEPGGNGFAEFVTPDVHFGRDAGWSPAGRVVGADLSFVPRLLTLGAEYRVEGAAADPLAIFADHGFGLVRLRLWHTPAEPWHGLDETLAYAGDVRAAGYDLMLDLHYSDTWADPAHQTKPAAWEGLDFPTLVDSVYAYTNAVVRRFRDADALPQYVQIGNEISGGLLWDDGRVGGAWDTPEQWDQLTALLAAGVAAVRDSLDQSEQPKIIIHLDNGGSNALCRWFFDHLEDAGLDFDVIGVSFYPWWHGTLTELRENLHDIAPRYSKEVMVVETAYPWTLDDHDGTGNFVSDPGQLHVGYPATPEGQMSFLRDLQAITEGVPGGLGSGPVYWEPAFISVPGGPPNPHENLTLFDFDADALPGLGFTLPWQSEVPGGEGHGGVPLLHPGGPNPFASDTSFCLTVPEGGAPVAVRVYDVTGRLVTTLSNGYLSGGAHEVRWAGRDRSGCDVSAGVYFVAAEVGEARARTKLLVLR